MASLFAPVLSMFGRGATAAVTDSGLPRPEKWKESVNRAKPAGYDAAVDVALAYLRRQTRADTLEALRKFAPRNAGRMTAVALQLE